MRGPTTTANTQALGTGGPAALSALAQDPAGSAAQGVLRLREYGPAVEVTLTPTQRDLLLASPARLQLEPVRGSTSRWNVSATNLVGVLRAADLVVEIRPKLPVANLLYLLGFACRLPPLDLPEAPTSDSIDLQEALAWLYTQALSSALGRGLPKGYVAVDEDELSVRGRIRFTDQVNQRPGLWLPIAVRRDEFTEDMPVNRLLKAALRRLLHLPFRNPKTPLLLRHWLRVFASVADLPPTRRGQYEAPPLNRLEGHLAPALDLALLILRGGSLSPEVGRESAPGLLLDLADLFERFVRESLRHEFGLSCANFPAAGAGRLHLDRARRIALRPDLLWIDGPNLRLVADVKYKRSADGKGHRSDLYQALAYAVRAGLDRAYLIHATPHEPVHHELDHDAEFARQIVTVGLDLSVPLPELRGSMTRLANVMKEAVQPL